MNDERGKPPRRTGRTSSAPDGRKSFGKPGAAGKPFSGKPKGGGKPFVKREGERPAYAGDKKPSTWKSDKPRGDRPFSGDARPGKKPFVKRDGDRPARADGPKREFRSDDRPRAERPFAPRGDRPFSKGPRPDGKPFVKREGDRPARADGPKREFRSDDRPRAERPFAPRGDRPFSKGPRPEGKPFVKREGDRPARADGPKREFRGDAPAAPDAKPFVRGARPGRNERAQLRGEPTSRDRKPFAGASEQPAEDGERIAKRLARAGISSRRDAEALIADGRVRVNGEVLTSPARNVLPGDKIELDGMEIPPIERTRLFLFHKPAGVVTTNRDPEGRRTVFDVLPKDLPRLITIGRLDINTEGLLLLTNDGGLARVLELPATGWLRRYRVRVHGEVDEAALQALRDGVAVGGVFYGSIEASLDRSQGTNAWLTLGLREGKNREVKNVLGSLGLEVTRLIRISFGPFQLGELADGAVLEIKGRMLRDQLGERLIEEAGANFEAEITRPFSNKPVRGERRDDRRDQLDDRAKPRRALDMSEGGLVKNNWRNRDQIREQALERLQTKPDRKPRETGYGGPDGFSRGRSDGLGRSKPAGLKPAGPRPAGGKPGGPGGPQGKREARERAENRSDPAKPRTAYVWTAPGARPTSRKPSGDSHDKGSREHGKAGPGKGRGPRKPGGRS
jgi:23S rRNA pseudouridine2605 synthase